jgi:hypothetical protein
MIDALAQEIRRVDGKNSLGAAALAEALMPFFQKQVEKLNEAGLKMLTVKVADPGHVNTLGARIALSNLIPTEGNHIRNKGDRMTIEAARRGEYGFGIC